MNNIRGELTDISAKKEVLMACGRAPCGAIMQNGQVWYRFHANALLRRVGSQPPMARAQFS